MLLVFLSIFVWWMSGLFFAGTESLLTADKSFWEWYWTFIELNGNPTFWATVFLLVVTSLCKDIYLCILDRVYNYKNYHILQEFEVKKGIAADEAEAQEKRSATVNADADMEFIGTGAL